jgi:hypothetical protein
MADVHLEARNEDPSRNVARVAWGVLLIWTGGVLLLQWGWGVGFVGAGFILLGAQVVRRYLGYKVEGFGLIAGALFVVCGAGSLFQVPIDLFPVLCILAGVALLVETWTARARRAPSEPANLQAPSHPRA